MLNEPSSADWLSVPVLEPSSSERRPLLWRRRCERLLFDEEAAAGEERGVFLRLRRGDLGALRVGVPDAAIELPLPPLAERSPTLPADEAAS